MKDIKACKQEFKTRNKKQRTQTNMSAPPKIYTKTLLCCKNK
jgi:hypothetical protein